jgi:hypothetical protein
LTGHDLLPTVAEVVLIPEHHPLIAEKFAQAPSFFVAHLRGVVGIGNPVFLLSEPENVEMIVFPSHDFLDHSMALPVLARSPGTITG